MKGGVPVVCGGRFGGYYSHSDKCYIVGNSTKVASMHSKRSSAAALAIDSDKTLWITGGLTATSYPDIYVNSTEFVYFDGREANQGPDLPLPLARHCMVRINQKWAMLIGGYQGNLIDYEHSTWLFDFVEQKWTPGPNMTHGKSNAACGLIRDSSTGETMVVVAGGFGDSESIHHLTNSTELWILESESWIPGPDLPILIESAAGVTSSNGRHFIVVGGGGAHSEELFDLYKLQCFRRKCEWNKMKQELTVARKGAVAMLLPDGLVTCNKKIN